MRRQVSIEDKPSASCNSWNKQAEDRRKRSGLNDSIEDGHSYASSTYNSTSNWLLAPSLLMQPALKWANVSVSHLALLMSHFHITKEKRQPSLTRTVAAVPCDYKRLLRIRFYFLYVFVLFGKLYMSHIPIPGTYRKSLTNVKAVQLVNHGGPKQTAA